MRLHSRSRSELQRRHGRAPVHTMPLSGFANMGEYILRVKVTFWSYILKASSQIWMHFRKKFFPKNSKLPLMPEKVYYIVA